MTGEPCRAYTVQVITFDDAMTYLCGLIDYEQTPAGAATARYLNLDRMRDLLARVGNPQQQFRSVHIAGTKGKGSTAAMTAAMLRAAGYRVGLFTSPHLLTFRERMRIDDTLISEDALTALVAELRPVIEAMRAGAHGAPTFFEAYTVLAFLWFARERVDIAVLETGMGGRLDATNVVQPLVTAITAIALDHMAELGDTLAAIAAEKAGIIKPATPVVSAPQEPEAAEVIARVAAEQGGPLIQVGVQIRIEPSMVYSPVRQRFSVRGQRGVYADLACPLLGEHQQVNAAVAIGIAESLRQLGMAITPAAIRDGIASVAWPGRMQVLQERPLLLLDGAHDPASVTALLAALDRHFPGRRRRYILGFARDKDWPQMLRQLAPSATELLLTAAPTPRAAPPHLLAEEAANSESITVSTAPDVAGALQVALAHATPDDLICVTGSLYIVGEALKWWQTQAPGASPTE